MSQINLHELFAEAPLAGPAVASVRPAPTPADELRLNLAVRGWTRPLDLGPTGADGLVAVAPEAETAAGFHPGKWFLRIASRMSSLALADTAALQQACVPRTDEDRTDPVLRAFSEALSPQPLLLAEFDDATLKALINVNTWLGPRWHQPIGAERINAEIAARTLSSDLDRMAQPLVGAVHRQALANLTEFVAEEPRSWLSYAYLFAAGGGGKTTVLANLQRELAGRQPQVAVARIDFDEPAIDPRRMITLNLALFEQLAASMPQLAERLADALPELRRSASALRASAYAEQSPFAGSAAGDYNQQQTLQSQKATSESAYDQASILFGLLMDDMLGGPLVIILDTAELVLCDNDRAAAGIISWLHFLRDEAHASNIRLIIAGRDPPPSQNNSASPSADLLSRLSTIGNRGRRMPLATHLPELAPDEAEELLKNSGVEDKGLRHAAARAVPGNPLLLRLTADALRTDDPSLATDVKTAHANAQVDPTSARTYMTRRIVAHVADPKARPFVIAAMVSPILTRPILSKIMAIVGPKTEDGKMQDPARAEVLRVFRSFGAATWLGRISLDGKTITFNRDLRRLVETLVDAVENDKAQWRTLQAGLYDYHAERSTSLDRALTVYHAAVLGHGYKMPRGPRVVSQLRGIIDQLPGDLRDRLTGVDRATAAAASPPEASGAPTADVAATPSDRDWTLYLEGSGKQPGQGEKLVQDDLAEEALKLYRGRPTRVPGLPPTFVIQAFADLGSWRSRDIDLPALVREMTEKVAQDLKGLSPDALSRLYWITRFAMLANAGRLSLPHLDLLAKACEGLRGPGLTMLPALVAIVEAESGRHLLGDRLIKGIRGHEAEARIALAWCEPVAGEIQVGQIAVTQHDWLRRTSILPLINGKSLDWAQQALDALGGKPIAAVNQTFADMRRTVAYKWDGRDVAQAILLLRGQTVEILRPLRETLAALYAAQPEAVIESILRPTIQQMTIRPKELEESIFTERLQANPRAWLTGFVGFADRARLLRGLCERIVEAGLEPGPATKDAVRVAAAFIAWDRALCSGGSSEWSIK